MTGAHPQTVLITGAAKRIGRAIALDFAAAGWRVAIHHRKSAREAQTLKDEIEQTGGRALAVACDLGDIEALEPMVLTCVEQLGPVTCLINNASVFEPDDILTVTPDSWANHIGTNLTAPIFLAQSFAQALPADMPGNIINMLDQRVWKLTPQFLSYTTSKTALFTTTTTLAQALAPQIRVNAIGPGPTLANKRQTERDFQAQVEGTPLKRATGIDEITACIRFILDSPSLTGQMIAPDGGQHLAWQTPDISGMRE
jgi:NAD(P)-dependent dehydrogenase (short-subunit alcohol dehydrogenase family)